MYGEMNPRASRRRSCGMTIAFHSTNFITSLSTAQIPFDATTRDDNGQFNAAQNAVIVKYEGLYAITYQNNLSAGTATRDLRLFVNGAPTAISAAAPSTSIHAQVTGLAYLKAGDVITVFIVKSAATSTTHQGDPLYSLHAVGPL